MRPSRQESLPARPGLRQLAIDIAIGVVLAWLLPDGINLLVGSIDAQWELGSTGLSDVEVAALTAFFLFVLQNVAWVNSVAAATTRSVGRQLDEWAETELPQTLSSSLLKEMASHVLGDGDSAPGYVRGLQLYTNVYGHLPQEARLGAALLLSRELQEWADHCEQLRTDGIDISQEEQVALIVEVCRSASTFLLVDPVLYEDIREDWTKGWRELVAGELAASDLQLEYVYLSATTPADMSREDRDRLDDLATFMIRHGWKFFVCHEREISPASVSAEVYARLLEVFDDSLVISMPKTTSFMTGTLTRTRLSIVDDEERRFVDAVRKYKQPYVPASRGRLARVSSLTGRAGRDR